MYALTMLLTKRHVCFLAANAALIFINFHLWVYTPNSSNIQNEFPGDAYDSYVETHMSRSRDGSDDDLDIYAPERVPGLAQNGKRNITRKSVRRKANTVRSWRQSLHMNLSKPESKMFATPINMKSLPERDFSKLRRNYLVPNIETTNLVNCAKVLKNDTLEMKRALQVLLTRPKVPIYEETYQEWFKDCANFRRARGYVEIPLTKVEEDFPFAFSIAMFKDFEHTERLIRSIYRPHNLYCIHVDIKSPLLLHRTVQEYASCFDNVWVATHLDKIKWGDVSVLLPELNCMRDLLKYYRNGKWKYFINLTGQEIPLRTNYELARIAQIFNGSNDIGGSISRMDPERIKYRWTHRWSKTYQQTIFYNTFTPKEPPPYNLTFYKGEIHGLFSRRMVEYIMESEVAKKYLEWCWNTGHPSEHYWNTLNYNKHVAAPGGYEGPIKAADDYSSNQIARVKDWLGLYDNRTCHGKTVRGICVYGVEDAPWLASRPELFANKFHLTYHYLGYDCLEELHRNRTKLKDNILFPEKLYKNLPTAKYSRKDGLLP